MTPDEHTAAIRSLQSDVADIKGTLNNGLRAMVQDQRTELATVKEDIQQIRDAVTGHVAKEEASRAGESHPHALPEPYVSLSTHTAPSFRPFG
jgi:hypothetical protein